MGFPVFTEHCTVFYVQRFLAIFCMVPVLPDNPLQLQCPLAISLVVYWVEDLKALGVFELCRDKFLGKSKS
jgi:hypothetical protein